MGIPINHSNMPRMRSLLRVDAAAERGGGATFRAAHTFVSKSRSRRGGLLALPLLCLVAACAADPAGNYLFGFGDPVRGAALFAPRNLGDTSRWAGQPAEAAQAAAQLEFLADAMRTSPRYAPVVNPAVTTQLDLARDEMRQFLGIAPAAEPAVVIAGLRRAAAALDRGSRAEAEAALAGPTFTAGPLVTLERLGAMPRLPRTSAAASLAASEIARLDRRT